MKVDPIRLFLRLFCLGFILGRFKKRELRRGHERWFANVVFPLPAGNWIPGNDFLWESKQIRLQKIDEGDWLVFFGYRSSSGWKAKWVLKIF